MFLGVPSGRELGNLNSHQGLRVEKGGYVLFGDQCLDLSSKPMTFMVFDALVNGRRNSVHKQDLVECIYGSISQKSERMRRALRHNTVKLVSRCRLLAEASFGSTTEGLRIRWMPFDHQKQVYRAYEASFTAKTRPLDIE